MADVRYEKLDRIREDIKRDKAKVVKLQEQIKAKGFDIAENAKWLEEFYLEHSK